MNEKDKSIEEFTTSTTSSGTGIITLTDGTYASDWSDYTVQDIHPGYSPLSVSVDGTLIITDSILKNYKGFIYHSLSDDTIYVEKLKRTFNSYDAMVEYLDELVNSPNYKALYE